jgi:hypothetical protein
MALDLLPYSEWAAGTLQNSVPANTNALRSEVLAAHVISDTVTAQPATPADGDCYIIPTGRTGTAWATFAIGSLAYFRGGTWYEFTAYEGLLKVVGAALKLYTGSAWAVYGGGGGGGGGGGLSVVQTVTGTAYTVAAADNGKFLRFTNASAKAATFEPQSTTPQADDSEWIFRNDATGNLTLVAGSGVTLKAPAGGSLVIPPDGTAAAKRLAADVFAIFGSTNP